MMMNTIENTEGQVSNQKEVSAQLKEKQAPSKKLKSWKKKAVRKSKNLLTAQLLGKQVGRWFTATVLLPLLIAAIYYVAIASDRYVSMATFMIERSDGNRSMAEGISLFGMAPQASNDLKILENFIQSPDMLNYLERSLSLRQHYFESADWLSSLAADASYDEFLTYYRDHISIRYNDSNGLLDLSVQAFSPKMAEDIASEILRHSEAFVNLISHNMATEQQAFVEKEVNLYEKRLREATNNIVNFQNQYGLLSATDQSVALSTILNELKAELIRNRTELQTLSSYLNGNAPEIIALKQRIKALEQQLGEEQKRLTSEDQGSMNTLSAQQQELQLNVELATKAYTSALVALETTRTEASRKLKQLVVISSPYQAEEATYPRVLYNLANIFIILLMVFALIRMVYATIMEHRD